MINWIKRHQRLLGNVLIAIALGWLVAILWKDFNSIWEHRPEFDAENVLIACIFAVTSLFLLAYVYLLTLQRLIDTRLHLTQIIFPFFIGQVAKYLPGRIWSILIQAQRMSPIVPAACTWFANAELILYSNLITILVATLLYLFTHGWHYAAFFAYTLVFAILFVAIKDGWLYQMLKYMTSRFTQMDSLKEPSRSVAKSLGILVFFQIEWLFYMLVWVALLWSDYSIGEACILAVIYIAAWMVGFLTFIVPSGIVVREAMFVWLGVMLGFEPVILVIYGVVARILFVVADLLAAFIGFVLERYGNRVSRHHG